MAEMACHQIITFGCINKFNNKTRQGKRYIYKKYILTQNASDYEPHHGGHFERRLSHFLLVCSPSILSLSYDLLYFNSIYNLIFSFFHSQQNHKNMPFV